MNRPDDCAGPGVEPDMRSADERRRAEAADWFLARRGPMPVARNEEFEQWQLDPANLAALRAMEAGWESIADARDRFPKPDRARSDRRRLLARGGALAASFAAAALVWRFAVPDTSWQVEARTGIGEQRSLTLADGSVIHLNVATTLRARLVGQLREVILDAGDAEFEVAPDPERPFVVRAGARRVRVIGTRFGMTLRDGRGEVAVREGVVALSRPDRNSQSVGQGWSGDQIVLHAGDAITYAGQQIAPLRHVAPDQVAEWRRRVLTFERAMLKDVVRDLNRYFPGTISIEDARFGEQRLTIRLPVADRDRTLERLAELAAARIERNGDDAVLRAKK